MADLDDTGPYVVWSWKEITCRLVSARTFATREQAKEFCEGCPSLAVEPIGYTPLGAKLESLVLLDQLRRTVRSRKE